LDGTTPIETTLPTTTLETTTTSTTTSIPATTTTVAVVNAAVRAPTPRVCPQASMPPGGATQLATPNAPNLAYSASPSGPVVGHVSNPWGGPTTRPVVDQRGGWVAIRLYDRPNGAVGWVPAADVSFTTTTYRIVISICQRTLTVLQGTDAVYSSPVGVGRPQWPTPLGPTFVDAIVATPRGQLSVYGPTVIMLGLHSNVLTDFDGGDGVVAIHGYPSDPASTRGVASSHGCVRSSPATIDNVKALPVGTPVDVVA
jgi:hypothetical protein